MSLVVAQMHTIQIGTGGQNSIGKSGKKIVAMFLFLTRVRSWYELGPGSFFFIVLLMENALILRRLDPLIDPGGCSSFLPDHVPPPLLVPSM